MGITFNKKAKHKLTLFYKMNNGLCPNYLTSLVPQTVGNNTTYSLRNASNIQTIHANRSSTITHFYRQLFETGMNYQWTLVMQAV